MIYHSNIKFPDAKLMLNGHWWIFYKIQDFIWKAQSRQNGSPHWWYGHSALGNGELTHDRGSDSMLPLPSGSHTLNQALLLIDFSTIIACRIRYVGG